MDPIEKFQELGKGIKDMMSNGCSSKIYIPKAVGYLEHPPTGYTFYVYKPIPRFQALMLNWCFGLKYKKI